MKLFFRRNSTAAFTLLELLVVISIIVILAALLLPALAKTKAKANQIACLNNLKQIGAAAHMFAHEHGDKFPVQVSTNQGGSLEYNQTAGPVVFSRSFHNFQVMSNELGTPKILVCQSDKRAIATNFITLKDENVSYFSGICDTDPARPSSIVAGDWNVTYDASFTNSSGEVFWFVWTKQVHEDRGNLLFADGRVELVKTFWTRKTVSPPAPAGSTASYSGGGGTASRGNPIPRATVPQSTPMIARESRLPVQPAESTATPKLQSSTANAPLMAVSGMTPTESWDTENFRFAVTLAKAGYLLLLLIAILLLLMYFRRRRRIQTRQSE